MGYEIWNIRRRFHRISPPFITEPNYTEPSYWGTENSLRDSSEVEEKNSKEVIKRALLHLSKALPELGKLYYAITLFLPSMKHLVAFPSRDERTN